MDRGLSDLIIARIPGLSCAERVILAEHCGEERDLPSLLENLPSLLGRAVPVPGLDSFRRQAEQDVLRARICGMDYAAYGSPRYPPLLREIPDPPVVLFYRGILPDPETPMAAVVGTRRPSGGGAAAAYDIARDLGRGGIPVVSGLALGIDALAHRGNLEGAGATAAVLGSSLDEVYPASNRALARSIVERGGVLLSEYPPGTGPRKWHFPARNRIIAGLARGTVIVEAPVFSGALITARFALDQGRDLWVSAAGIASPLGEGTRRLAEEGARIISGAASILEEWGMGKHEETSPELFGLALSLAREMNIRL